MTPLNEIWGRLRRAEQHHQAWQALFDEWAEGDTYRIQGVRDEATGWMSLRLVDVQQPPLIPLAVIYADYLHNVRGALDNLIWHLVTLDGGTPNTNTSFPVIREEKDWRSALGSKLRGFPSELVDVVKRAQPFSSPGDPTAHWLYLLHQLDVHNKHKLLVRLQLIAFDCEPDFRFERDPGEDYSYEASPSPSPPELAEGAELTRLRAVSEGSILRIEELVGLANPRIAVAPLIDFLPWRGPIPDFTAEVRKVVKALAPAFDGR